MNREALQKYYPAIIGVGILAPLLLIYFTFFRVSPVTPEHVGTPAQIPPTPKAGEGGFNRYPAKDASVEVQGKMVPLETLREEVTTAPDQRSKVAAINLLGDNHDLHAAPMLLDLLTNDDPYVRGQSGAALTKILGADFHYRANMPEAQRKVTIEEMRRQAAKMIAHVENPNAPPPPKKK
ncbi:MAG TPA: HEAT repeat domain-containing protein [Pirellulales bacterium]|jgi:hypothetical protein|nr:HEAT repeat domain-containing protein [Pirellulales bacterium]